MKSKVIKKPRGWYKRDPAIVSAVQYCINWNYSITDSINYISIRHGCKMSEKTFRRIKMDLTTTNTQRLEILSDGSITFILESLDVLRTIEVGLFKIFHDTNEESLTKIKAAQAISKTRLDMAEFYDASPVIASLSELKGVNENVIQKPEETSKEKLP